MNIIIGIWKDENGDTYFKCTNCSNRSQPSTELSATLLKARYHRSECKSPARWTDTSVDGRPQTLIGIEMISL